jgi:hypothetical protein
VLGRELRWEVDKVGEGVDCKHLNLIQRSRYIQVWRGAFGN